MSSIPDITSSEEWVVKTSVTERCWKDIELQFADSEIRLSAADRELAECTMSLLQAQADQMAEERGELKKKRD